MPDLVVTINEGWITIDGPLPEGYRLIVHNHTGDVDFYSYVEELEACRYGSPAEELDDDEIEDGGHCYLYVEKSAPEPQGQS